MAVVFPLSLLEWSLSISTNPSTHWWEGEGELEDRCKNSSNSMAIYMWALTSELAYTGLIHIALTYSVLMQS